jgi:hypothetical protein
LLFCSLGNSEARDAKPVVLFVGDSITMGQPKYHPSADAAALKADLTEGRNGYFDALVEATATKEIPFPQARQRRAGTRRLRTASHDR